MRLEDLGLIGNCQFSALVSRRGDVAWCCLPRFDSEPVFAGLLDADRGGRFTIAPADDAKGTQRYIENTNVLETVFASADGAMRVLDFAPRFMLHDRSFRPTQIVRIVEPISGSPHVRVACEPCLGWSRRPATPVLGSNHVQFEGHGGPLRLTTDIPLSYLGGPPFALTERRHFVLAWGPPVEEPLAPLCERFLAETVRYWQRWTKHCNIPPLFQEEVIRSALVLKLHCFEDTGAIVAATTTSIPESPGSGRTWDYRYCWLRDAAYVLGAFRLLGHFEERELFVRFLLDIVGRTPSLDLAPLYRIDGTSELEERVLPDWAGFEGEKPVRVGNAAASFRQNDIYGEVILALAPVMLDARFRVDHMHDKLGLLEHLAKRAIAVAGAPDAGIWEYRKEWTPQTFTSLMCWAGADRMARVAERHLPDHAADYRKSADAIHRDILEKSWSDRLQSFVASGGGSDLDASLLQVAQLHFLPQDDPRLRSSIDTMGKRLAKDGWLFRYHHDDGFGAPTVAFILCTFWYVEALVATGRVAEGREVLERATSALSPLGLLSEDFDAATPRLWGNYPQAYSHVGLIHAAFASSPRWADIL
ncbi:MAG TPA: glycoside hydrolase family 15 protein [Candidatus Polarisedimenticolia bacterium]|nr:glycoside hydrolase family 15 protein [Candidatus Polarisedimenticolia bacterium]